MKCVRVKRLHVKIISVNSAISTMTGPTNCVVVWRKGVAVVVDPGGEGAKIARFLRRMKLTVGAYWLTHGHPDHVGGLPQLLEEFPAPVKYHKADSGWIKVSLPLLSLRRSEWFDPYGAIRKIVCGDIVAKVIMTPGHSHGSVCYWLDEAGVLLSGDTLMQGCVGATIYPGGDSAELANSLRKIFNRIPVDVKVLPGHGVCTMIGAEGC